MTTTAADIMTSNPIVVAPEASVAEVAALLSDHHISSVPVCAADGGLLGLVSEADILRPFGHALKHRRDWWLGLIAEGEELAQDYLDYLRTDTRTAWDVMARQVVTAEAQTSAADLAGLMIEHGVRRVPIVEENRVIGMVSRADLVRAVAHAKMGAL